jgi:hypothetical protein
MFIFIAMLKADKEEEAEERKNWNKFFKKCIFIFSFTGLLSNEAPFTNRECRVLKSVLLECYNVGWEQPNAMK